MSPVGLVHVRFTLAADAPRAIVLRLERLGGGVQRRAGSRGRRLVTRKQMRGGREMVVGDGSLEMGGCVGQSDVGWGLGLCACVWYVWVG